MKVLFVCLGNICRSPAAEGVVRRLAPDWETDSAGTGDWHVGKPPYGPMLEAARARGLEIGDLRARQVTARDFERFDVICAMDRQNFVDLDAMRPEGSRADLRMFDERDVPDPYYTRDFDGALDLIEAAAARLVNDRSVRPSA